MTASQRISFHPVTNPATGAVLAEIPYGNTADIDRAVRHAHQAFLTWREVPVVDRVQPLYRFKTLLEKHAHEIASILTSENGKTVDDARAEVRRAIQMVEVACGMPTLMMGDSLNDVAKGIDCKTIRQPIGVCAGITPFNFPAMVPLWMYPFAIACGNTFVLKPSEKVPLTPTRMVELLHDAGLPHGVMNLVHGDKETVDALLHHPLVKAVSFVGSTPVAKYIYTTAAAEGKRVQALGGAKNHLVVMPDADMPKTVEAIIGSAFGAAGERCLAGSILVPVGKAAGPLLNLLLERTRAMAVGDGARDGVEMGPLVTSDHCRKVAGYIEKGVAEGATPLCDGRDYRSANGGYFLGPTIFDNVTPEMTIAREEIFGPVLSILGYDAVDEAIEIANDTEYGLSAYVSGADPARLIETASRLRAGQVHLNNAPMDPMAPFGGYKMSGNGREWGDYAFAEFLETKAILGVAS